MVLQSLLSALQSLQYPLSMPLVHDDPYPFLLPVAYLFPLGKQSFRYYNIFYKTLHGFRINFQRIFKFGIQKKSEYCKKCNNPEKIKLFLR